MKVSEMHAKLYCLSCNDDTSHVITYVNSKINGIQCEECHRTQALKMNLVKEFQKEVYERISTKPVRITQEYKEDLSKLLASLPIRILSKPYRLMRYLNETRKVFKLYSDKKG
ncbi:bh protein [Metabacillus endolithicus]|uniref:Bh protein n=1 Tax=Metabacillus endolithicus TaxID=1535204 RepID=A0ABW5BXU4_9BACI|nr:bh protein [Metabacillus endolithicus]UPG65296.1 bh protein [Metabacillus endolithicus]